jgi:hypothetical protein
MDEPFGDTFSGLYFLSAIGGVGWLLSGHARSLWARIVSGGFIVIGAAYIWWFLRWNADGCTDTGGACGGLETALKVIFAVWAALVVTAVIGGTLRGLQRRRPV